MSGSKSQVPNISGQGDPLTSASCNEQKWNRGVWMSGIFHLFFVVYFFFPVLCDPNAFQSLGKERRGGFL